MGISALQHRTCIGLFNSSRVRPCGIKITDTTFGPHVIKSILAGAGIVLYVYILCVILAMLAELSDCHSGSNSWNSSTYSHIFYEIKFSDSFSIPNNIMCASLTVVILLRYFSVKYQKISPEKFKFLNYLSCKLWKRCTTSSKIINICSIWLYSLNLMLIIIAMPGIKSPGPQLPSKISVLYHNVQGFLITRELHKENPLLDTKKYLIFKAMCICINLTLSY